MLIKPGTACALRINLPVKHQGIRIDEKSRAVPTTIPKGASGQVLKSLPKELYLELYWNPSRVSQQGYSVWLWVERQYFGILFNTKS